MHAREGQLKHSREKNYRSLRCSVFSSNDAFEGICYIHISTSVLDLGVHGKSEACFPQGIGIIFKLKVSPTNTSLQGLEIYPDLHRSKERHITQLEPMRYQETSLEPYGKVMLTVSSLVGIRRRGFSFPLASVV